MSLTWNIQISKLIYPRNFLFPYLHIMINCNVTFRQCITCGLLFLTFICTAQKEKQDLEAQRKALESQIKSTTEVLQKTQKNKSKSLDQLKALNVQISQRQELLASINKELDRLEKESNIQEKNKNEGTKTKNSFLMISVGN